MERDLLGFTGFYWVLPSLGGHERSSTKFYWVLPGFTGLLLGLTGIYWVLPVKPSSTLENPVITQ